MRYPEWLGQLGKKDEALRKHHGLYPAQDGWYKTIQLKKRWVGRPMPLADAVALLPAVIADVRGEVVEQEARLRTAGLTIEGLAESYQAHLWQRLQTGTPRKLTRRTYDDYLDTIGRFVDVVGPDRPAAVPSTQWFSGFARSIAAKAVSSRRRDMIYVTAFFNWAGPGRHSLGFYKDAVQFGPDFVKPDAATLQRAMDASSTFCAPEDLAKAFAAVRDCPLLLAAGLLGLNCAYLPSDITGLPERAVDLASGIATFPRGKNDVGRKAVLMPETVAAVRAYLAERPAAAPGSTALFLREGGRPFNSRREAGPGERSTHGHSVAAYWRQVTGLTFKGLRTTFATVADGFDDDRAVDVVMGHAAKTVRQKHYVKLFKTERLRRVSEHVWAQCGVEIPPSTGASIPASELVRRAVRRRKQPSTA